MAPITKAIILAGGRGERLQSTISDVPKPMAPIGGRPFLEYVLDELVDGGMKEIILSVGYRAKVIQDHFGDTYRTAELRYSREEIPLGTGGAMRLAVKQADGSPILVVNGDTFIKVKFEALRGWYATVDSLVGVVLRRVQDVSRYGAVILVGDRIVEFQEKGKQGPGLVNAGMYVIQPAIFSYYRFDDTFSFEADLLQSYCAELHPQAFVTNGYFVDIGTPADYFRAQQELGTLSVKQDTFSDDGGTRA